MRDTRSGSGTPIARGRGITLGVWHEACNAPAHATEGHANCLGAKWGAG